MHQFFPCIRCVLHTAAHRVPAAILCVCLSARNSAFCFLHLPPTLWLIPAHITRDSTKCGKVPTRNIAPSENAYSTFCSPNFLLGSYLILDDLSHNYQIKRKSKRHSFPKNQNRPKFWMLSVIRMSFSRRKIKRFLQFHTQASRRSISDLKSYDLT